MGKVHKVRRLAAKPGKKRAVIAVAHSLLVVIYTMLKQGKGCQDLGADYFEKLPAEDFKRYLVRKLEAQGYKVTRRMTGGIFEGVGTRVCLRPGNLGEWRVGCLGC